MGMTFRAFMNCRWNLAVPQFELAAQLAKELRLPALVVHCLLNRGYCEPSIISAFLEPRLKHLSDPFLLPNMGAAVERLMQARADHERVVIFGDYDVDGVTSTALLVEVLSVLGWEVDAYLPHRLEEGYGLSRDGVENCLKQFPARLLLAVDCGSTATETVRWLRKGGTDVIVLDHHQVSDPAPPASALVNPHLGERDAPDLTYLCSVGLAFKLAHALIKRARQQEVAIAFDMDLKPFLDLVALGTIADLAPLVGENRILVSAGLRWLNETVRPGLVALKAVAQTSKSIGIYEVAFHLAPRLNAAGRLENARRALQLLQARSVTEAEPLARQLDAQNRERQQIEHAIAEEAIGSVRARFDPKTDFAIVEGRLLWHIGVVGIVASRVLREFYRPTIIIGGDGNEWRGSGRSIDGFDLAAALRECDDLLIRHGGHALAAGVTIRPDKIDEFRNRLNAIARRTLSAECLRPCLCLDAQVRLEDLNVELTQSLQQIGPFGQGNAPVQLMAKGLSLKHPPQRMGRDQQHVKLRVADGGTVHEAVWWNAGHRALPEGPFDLAFIPQLNDFNGRRSVQLKVLDWRPA